MKYYAVKKGRKTGIFTSWDECKEEVIGYKGAIYKSFKNKEDAINFLEEKKEEIILEKDSVIAYVDGSYKKDEASYGAGIVYITENKIDEFYKRYDDSYSIHRNVAGEVKASELAIKKAIEDKKKKIYIYHDYQGIASWADGSWKANNELTKNYKDFIARAKEKIEISFVKVKGHSNDKYNDLADKLAKKALGIK